MDHAGREGCRSQKVTMGGRCSSGVSHNHGSGDGPIGDDQAVLKSREEYVIGQAGRPAELPNAGIDKAKRT